MWNKKDFLSILPFMAVFALLTWMVSGNSFFWDTIQLGSKQAHWFFENNFTYLQAFEKVTSNPAAILKIDRGRIAKGAAADITIINPDAKVSITNEFMLSRCKNSPFIGRELFGKVEYTICGGNIVYSAR